MVGGGLIELGVYGYEFKVEGVSAQVCCHSLMCRGCAQVKWATVLC